VLRSTKRKSKQLARSNACRFRLQKYTKKSICALFLLFSLSKVSFFPAITPTFSIVFYLDLLCILFISEKQNTN